MRSGILLARNGGFVEDYPSVHAVTGGKAECALCNAEKKVDQYDVAKGATSVRLCRKCASTLFDLIGSIL